MEKLHYMNDDIEKKAEDFEYVDKKKEALGCLALLGEELLGCAFQIGIVIAIFAIIGAIISK